jgi:hypothetical protein
MEDVSSRQRVTFLAIAAAIAVVAIVLLAAGGSDDEGQPAASNTSATATPTETATEAPEETSTPEPKPPLVRPGDEKKLRFTEGDTVEFRATSDIDDEVHVHGYDLEKEIPAGKTVTISFKATITGIFEVESHETEQVFAQLRVDPR